MSSTAAAAHGAGRIRMHLVQLVALLILFGILLAATRAAPGLSGVGTVTGVGFLLLAGTLVSQLVELLGLPHLTGYLLAGIIAGPYVSHLIDHESVIDLSSVNTLALALIAFAGGAELRIADLKRGLRTLVTSTIVQVSVVSLAMIVVFMLARPMMPFTQSLTLKACLGVAILWSVLATTRSPSALLGILSQTRAQGPLASFSLSFIMTSDVVVVVLLAAALTIAKTLIVPGAELSLGAFSDLGHEVLGSIALGTTLGLIIAAYMRLIGRQLLVVLLALGFGMSEVLHYLRFEPLLSFMTAGFVVQNLSKQGERFLHEVEKLGGVVYVIFFATAGAHLNIPLVQQLWPVAVLLCGSRAAFTWVANLISSKITPDVPELQRWGWSGMISQAGLALGVAAIIERNYPSFGDGFRSLSLATVALNEMIGPIVFKLALDRTGEVKKT